jgi:uncharacterized protein
MPEGPHIDSLWRYPVKGLSPERLDRVGLTAGATMPFDRAYAIENGPGRFDASNPKWVAKANFLMLMRNERLATLETRFEDATRTLVIKRDGKQVAHGALDTPTGRQVIEQFLAAYVREGLRGAPKVQHVEGHSFSDVAAKCLHIINLASLRELERVAGRSLDPLRFRANVHIDGVPAWAEMGWVGRSVRIGTLSLDVFDRTGRCEATNVDPKTGARDMAIPALLQRTWGHTDFGIYARVREAGEIAAGAALTIV